MDFKVNMQYAAASIGFQLTEYQLSQFEIYKNMLCMWNQKINLTAITEENEILEKHFIDSIKILQIAKLDSNTKLADVGSGAGFPSIPIHIVRPDISITIIEALEKRLKFLKALCKEINVDCTMLHARAEEAGHLSEHRAAYDYVIARAVAKLNRLSEYCLPLVKKNGLFYSMKGRQEESEHELIEANRAIDLLGGKIHATHYYQLNDDERSLIVIKKLRETDLRYPRRSAQIKKTALS